MRAVYVRNYSTFDSVDYTKKDEMQKFDLTVSGCVDSSS